MSTQRLLKPALALATALALALVGCGGTEPNANPGTSTETGPLLPMAVGAMWEYKVTDPAGVVSQKRTTVFDKEVVGGTGPYAAVIAFKVVTRKGPDLNSETGLDKTESWQGPEDGAPERILRYRELSYGATSQLVELDESWDPPRIHVDGTAARTVTGKKWIEEYVETKLPFGLAPPAPQTESDLWEVVNGDESVTVAGVTYPHSVRLKKTAYTSSARGEKEYWYQRSVGKLKETGTQTEELVKYTPGTEATP